MRDWMWLARVGAGAPQPRPNSTRRRSASPRPTPSAKRRSPAGVFLCFGLIHRALAFVNTRNSYSSVLGLHSTEPRVLVLSTKSASYLVAAHVQLRRVPFAPAGSAAELVRCTALRGVHLEDLRHPYPHHHPNHHLHPPHHPRPSPSATCLPSCQFPPSCRIGRSSRIPHGSCGCSSASPPTLRHTPTGRSPCAG